MITAEAFQRFAILRLRDAPDVTQLKFWLNKVDAVDLDAVYDVLTNAKRRQIDAAIADERIKLRRDWETGREKARGGLIAARNWFESLYLGHDDLADIRKRIRHVDLLKFPLDGPDRRQSPGRQKQPWVNDAIKQLRELRISKELARNLLEAIGVRKSHEYPEERHAGRKRRPKTTRRRSK